MDAGDASPAAGAKPVARVTGPNATSMCCPESGQMSKLRTPSYDPRARRLWTRKVASRRRLLRNQSLHDHRLHKSLCLADTSPRRRAQCLCVYAGCALSASVLGASRPPVLLGGVERVNRGGKS